MVELQQAYINKGENYTPRTRHLDQQGRAKFVNHLILESSPYLLQHAHNPVDWYAFSDKAFNKAKRENKPIFISIGYATCHWCHVMEEESFDDVEVADFLNKHFVAIKVDREIHPDVDATYMNVAQLLNGTGGWPLNAVLLPDGKAFFAGVYFPKSELLKILEDIAKLWKNQQNDFVKQANDIAQILSKTHTTQGLLDKNITTQSVHALLEDFDEFEGGFGQAPKFPNESLLLLLIDEQKRHPNNAQLNVITTTLDAMASGGLYDVVGGGFHRYSTDNAFLVPHFEKMLYNQAQLALVYTRAYQLNKKPLYKRIAKQTLDYVLREMRSETGGFLSATDADSEGQEGTFFTWSIEQLQSVLNNNEFKQFSQWFDLSSDTDFKDKQIIRFQNINAIKADDYPKIDAVLNKLYSSRNQREAPLTDYKILLSWNALMVLSLLEAGYTFNEEQYTQDGLVLANYLQTFQQDQQRYRVSINNKLETKALFEDYAYLANAYLSVFDQTHDNIWLDRVTTLIKAMNDKFWDETNAGFNMSEGNKYLNTHHKESYDGATPSSNAIAYQVLIKLNNRDNNPTLAQQAQQLIGAFSQKIEQNPTAYSSFISGFNDAEYGELGNVNYAYNGRVRIQTTKLDNHQVIVDITLKPHWHINSNKPLQDSLIATQIHNKDSDNWHIGKTVYPQGKLMQLGFSKEEISVYKNQLVIKVELLQRSKNYVIPTLSLTLQACSNKVCLPPTTLILKP